MRRLALIPLIAAGVLAWFVPLSAQQPKVPVIGLLSTASAGARSGEQYAAFYRGLAEGGFIEGQNLAIQYRWANDDYSRLPALATELVQLRVAVIVAAGGHVTALAAHAITKDIPIVFTTVTDPVQLGLVASFNKPGGNVTGTAGLTSELDAKRLELMHDLKPSAAVYGVLVNPNRPGLQDQSYELQAAADNLKLKLHVVPAATEQEIDAAFDRLVQLRVDALVVTADPFFNNRRKQVIALAAKYAMAAIYQWREFVAEGGLISYGPGLTDAYHQAGVYTANILKGAKPIDLPVIEPTRFQLVINSRTAKALGLPLSSILLTRTDEVIE